MDVSLISAFLGGVLALLSPCGALLLPAFFASTLGNSLRLLVHGAIFYLGLVITLVPLGLGLGMLGGLLVRHRDLLVVATAILLIVLGIAQALGFGFDLSKLLPGSRALQETAQSRTGILKSFLLGAASGVAGFCAGPILGAILTLAVAQGNAIGAGIMLAFYALGMVLPLVLLAALWNRLSPKTLSTIRGRTFRVFGHELHTTSFITGLLIMAVGVLFWTTNGLVNAPSLLPTSAQRALQSLLGMVASAQADMIMLGVIAIVLAAVAVFKLRSRA